MDVEHALNQLIHGHATAVGNREGHRWAGNPATRMLDDFERLMELLFSEEHDQSVKYRLAAKEKGAFISVPETKLDVITRVWESVLPTRELVIGGGKVEAKHRGAPQAYPAREMSDGERVIFYLIGEALCVPNGGLFIVDEPELHLHRAVQARLWDAIEAERPDCVFVYLTHDLDFAASRKGGTLVWLREYTNESWDSNTVPPSEGFSEPMLLEVLGSRKPILFMEGDKGSLDYFVYGKVYPEWTPIPCGSCDEVVHATASFETMKNLHSNKCRGFVDADARSMDAVSVSKESNVDALPFAEIENLFLTEPVIRYAAKVMSLDEAETVAKVKKCVWSISKGTANVWFPLLRPTNSKGRSETQRQSNREICC